MYELRKINENDYYIDCPSKIGLVKLNNNDVILIDSGNDKSTGRKIRQILDKNGWNLKAIYNTHSHADHIGGNRYLQNQTKCKIYAPAIEDSFANYPILNPSFLYGGFPVKELKHKFLLAQESKVEQLSKSNLPDGFEVIELPGHSLNMVGYRTPNNTIFLADSLTNQNTLDKYGINVLYDVEAYLNSLEKVINLQADYFVPSHAAASKDVSNLAQNNINKVHEIGNKILELCENPKTFENILEELFNFYNLTLSIEQYTLVGSTVRSYLSWLKELGKLNILVEDNKLFWKTIKKDES